MSSPDTKRRLGIGWAFVSGPRVRAMTALAALLSRRSDRLYQRAERLANERLAKRAKRP